MFCQMTMPIAARAPTITPAQRSDFVGGQTNRCVTSGDIHAVPEEVIVLNHHITLMHSHPKGDAAVRRDFPLGFGCRALYPHGAAHRLHRARKLDEDAVASRFNDPAVVFPNDRIDDMPP